MQSVFTNTRNAGTRSSTKFATSSWGVLLTMATVVLLLAGISPARHAYGASNATPVIKGKLTLFTFPAGVSNSVSTAMNDLGDVVGNAIVNGNSRAFEWNHKTKKAVLLGVPAGHIASYASGINDHGYISANAISSAGYVVHAYVVSIKGSKPLWTPLPGSTAKVQPAANTHAIASNNDIAGSAVVGGVPLAAVWHFYAPNKWKFMYDPYSAGAAGGVANALNGKPSFAFGHVIINGGQPKATIWNNTGSTGKIVKIKLRKGSVLFPPRRSARTRVLSLGVINPGMLDDLDIVGAECAQLGKFLYCYFLIVQYDPQTDRPVATYEMWGYFDLSSEFVDTQDQQLGPPAGTSTPVGSYIGTIMPAVPGSARGRLANRVNPLSAARKPVEIVGHATLTKTHQQVGTIWFDRGNGTRPVSRIVNDLVTRPANTSIWDVAGATLNKSGKGDLAVTASGPSGFIAGKIRQQIK
jgi:hypothetical protein